MLDFVQNKNWKDPFLKVLLFITVPLGLETSLSVETFNPLFQYS